MGAWFDVPGARVPAVGARLANLADQRFWRLNKKDDYGPLNELGRHVVNTRLIPDHWEDMLRLARSLKFGTVKAAAVMRTLQRSGLERAVAELGRVEKTQYLSVYVQDEACRRRTLKQLNRGGGGARWLGPSSTAKRTSWVSATARA